MKEPLKRIKETLNQLERQKSSAYFQPGVVKSRTYSFEILLEPPKDDSPQTPEADKVPQLPNLNAASNSYSDPEAEINLEINSLPETQPDIAEDKTQLEQVVDQIQELYYEGPMVDGWLEYYPPAPEPSVGMLREVVFERPLDDLEVDHSLLLEKNSCELSDSSYRLSGLDASGQQWSYPCPLEQLPSVSMAIARYQKLQQLLQKKLDLETRLHQEQGAGVQGEIG
jgi:hypothetical protein